MTQVNCKYLDGAICNHPRTPLGKRPHLQKCLRFCEVYDGPPRPHFVKITTGATQGGSSGCSACGGGVKTKPVKAKYDPAEAMRVLNKAIDDGLTDDNPAIN